MNETYYLTAPDKRLVLIKDWLDLARDGNTHFAAVFRRPDFLQNREKDVCYRRCMAYLPVPYLAERFCQKFLQCHIWDWVSGRAPEPETGEVGTVAT